MNTNSIKQSVVATYGKLAKSTNGNIFSNLFNCCNLSDVATEVSEKVGYSNEEINSVPKGSNLGVGCGNPSALANISNGQTVVDLGSGAGFDAFLVASLVGGKGQVIGIDLSDEMLALATKNSIKGGYENVNFVKGDIEEIPLDGEIADLVISNCVINLSLRKDQVFNEAYRILKPEGQLSISDIVLEKELPAFIKNSLAGHIACVSGAEKLESYLQYITDAGFKDVKVETKTAFPLEFILTDPQVKKLAKELNFEMNSEEAKDIASRVVSVSISAKK